MSFQRLPLSALRAFHAAARHQGYSRAAEELGLSHGAVSHHIKSLESLLGVALFERHGNRMVPTEHGQRLAVHTSEGFAHLAQGFEEVKARLLRSRMVTMSVLPALAGRWLIPRLADFHERHPDVDVNLRASPMLVDFSRDGIDLALRYGPGKWAGLTSELLFEEELFPVCSPRFKSMHTLDRPRDLLSSKLLRDQRVPWSHWFRAAGLQNAPEPGRGPLYSDAGLLLQAAVASHGVALARSVLVSDELASGQLLRLFDIGAPAEFAYFVVYPSGETLRPPAMILKEWLLHQASPATPA